jgi:hypothetical protein
MHALSDSRKDTRKTTVLSSTDVAKFIMDALAVNDPKPVIVPVYEHPRCNHLPDYETSFSLLVAILSNEIASPDHERRAVQLSEASLPLAQRYLDLVHALQTERVASLVSCFGRGPVRRDIQEILNDRKANK